MTVLPREAYDLLDAIAGTESPDYYTIYGGQKVRDLSWHPGVNVPIARGPNAGRTSSAAGRYQFLESTWNDQAKKLNLEDFSPSSQDAAAWNLANEEFSRRTGRDLLTALQERGGPDPAILSVLRHQWTSLPGGIEENARYRNTAMKVADSGQTIRDTGPTPLLPSDSPEARAIVSRMSGGQAPSAAGDSRPSLEPLRPSDDAVAKGIVARMTAKPPEPEQPPQQPVASQEDTFWNRIKQEYGPQLDAAQRYGQVGVSSLAHMLPGIIDTGRWAIDKSLLGPLLRDRLPPVGAATEFFDQQFPELAAHPQTPMEKAIAVGVPMLLPGGQVKAIEKAGTAGKALTEIGKYALKNVPLAATTGGAVVAANQAFDPKKNPIAGTAAEVVASVLPAIAGGLGRGAYDVATNAWPSKARLERLGLSSTLGLTDQGAELLPKGVTPAHVADALDQVMSSGTLTMKSPSALDVMATPEFRTALTNISGVDVPKDALSPFLRLGFFQMETPATSGARAVKSDQSVRQRSQTTEQFLQPAFADTPNANAPLSTKEALAASFPEKAHATFYQQAQDIHNRLQANLDRVVATGIGNLDNNPSASGEALREIASNSAKAVSQAKRELFQGFEKQYGGSLYHSPANTEEVLASVAPGMGVDGIDPRYLKSGTLKQIIFDLNHEIGKEQPDYIRQMVNDGLIKTENLKEPLVKGVLSRPVAEAARIHLNDVLAETQSAGGRDFALAAKLKEALDLDQETIHETSWATMPPELAAQYKPAYDAMRKEYGRLAELTKTNAIKTILDKRYTGQFNVDNASVGPVVLRNRDSVAEYLALAKEAGTDPTPAIRDELDTIFSRPKFTDPRTGNLKPVQVQTWISNNQEMISQLPEGIRSSLEKVGRASKATDLHDMLSDSTKLRALVGADPLVTDSATQVAKMLSDGQRGVTRQDLKNFAEVSGLAETESNRLIGDAMLQQIGTTFRTEGRLTARQKLTALTQNDESLRHIYRNSPEIHEALEGMKQTLTAKSNLEDVARTFNSATVDKFAAKGLIEQKGHTSTLYRVFSFLAFSQGGLGGLGLGVGGAMLKGDFNRMLNISERALMEIYSDPAIMAQAYRSPNMKKAIEEAAIDRALQFQEKAVAGVRGMVAGDLSTRFAPEDQASQ